MLECLLDRDDHNRRRLFAIDGKAPLEVCILRNLCAPVHPIGLIHPGHEENQCNPRILNKVLEAIDPIVTATVRYANVRSQTGETVPMKTDTPFLGRVNTLLRTQLVETLEDHTDILRLFRIWIHVLKPTD